MNYATNYYNVMQYDTVDVEGQGSYGACFAFATTTTISTMLKQAGIDVPALSPLAYYSFIREAQNAFNTDSGTNINKGIQTANTKGFVPESMWAYEEHGLYESPTQAVRDAAQDIHTTSWTSIGPYFSVTNMKDVVKYYLAQGKPLVLSFIPQEHFYHETGPLDQQWNWSPLNSAYTGGHAVEIIGIDDNLNGGSYIVNNSWGTGWGDNGYGTIKYTAFNPAEYYNQYPWPIFGIHSIDGVVVGDNTYNFKYTEQRSEVNANYATILGRPADIVGLDYWASILTATNDLVIAQSLFNSTEGQAMYGSMDSDTFVSTLYQRVLGRNADSGGLDYWSNRIDEGLDKATLFKVFIDVAQTQNGDGYDYLSNKLNLANYISIAKWYDDGQHDVELAQLLAQTTTDDAHTEALKIGLPEILGY